MENKTKEAVITSMRARIKIISKRMEDDKMEMRECISLIEELGGIENDT